MQIELEQHELDLILLSLRNTRLQKKKVTRFNNVDLDILLDSVSLSLRTQNFMQQLPQQLKIEGVQYA